MSSMPAATAYPAWFDVEYTDRRDRLTVLLRLILGIPIFIVSALITATVRNLSLAIVLMLLFRGRYPRAWFDWYLYAGQLSNRISSYVLLLVDEYPSTTDPQRVTTTAELDETALSRWLPLVKWILAIPHYIVIALLGILVVLVTVVAWFAILITGRFPRGLFNFVVGATRWTWRVNAYAFLLSTDRYPPFSLK